VPYIEGSGELKTKPTQHSVKALREIGIDANILICRSPQPLTREVKKKIGLFCNVPPEAVIQDIDMDSIYELPVQFHGELLDNLMVHYLKLLCKDLDLSNWSSMIKRLKNPEHKVKIIYRPARRLQIDRGIVRARRGGQQRRGGIGMDFLRGYLP
jgi:CTP synthase